MGLEGKRANEDKAEEEDNDVFGPSPAVDLSHQLGFLLRVWSYFAMRQCLNGFFKLFLAQLFIAIRVMPLRHAHPPPFPLYLLCEIAVIGVEGIASSFECVFLDASDGFEVLGSGIGESGEVRRRHLVFLLWDA
jgi:hypothetical protein